MSWLLQTALALSVLLAALPVGASAPKYAIGGWLELDAEGGVESFEVLYEPAPNESLRNAAVALVEATRFEPPVIDGTPQPSRSWLKTALSFEPEGESYAISLSDPHLGPRMVKQGVPALVGLMSSSPINVVISYTVTVEGKAEDVIIENLGKRLPNQAERVFRDWARTLRFEPVQIDGIPVASRVRLPLCLGRLGAGHEGFQYPAPARDPAAPGAPGQTANDLVLCFTAKREFWGTIPGG